MKSCELFEQLEFLKSIRLFVNALVSHNSFIVQNDNDNESIILFFNYLYLKHKLIYQLSILNIIARRKIMSILESVSLDGIESSFRVRFFFPILFHSF